jgi:hypothetical protein
MTGVYGLYLETVDIFQDKRRTFAAFTDPYKVIGDIYGNTRYFAFCRLQYGEPIRGKSCPFPYADICLPLRGCRGG